MMSKEHLVPEIIDGKLSIKKDNMTLCQDFSLMKDRISPHRLNGEMLIKAARIKGQENSSLTILDATAGLGEDSFLLAAAGFKLILVEYNRTIYELLEDGLRRGLEDPDISHIVSRMNAINGNSIDIIESKEFNPDIIYLDPMFPTRKKSGLIKKKFQIMQELENPTDMEIELLEAAINFRPRKIIIKRPLKAQSLGDIKPTYSIEGSVIRYDCIVM